MQIFFFFLIMILNVKQFKRIICKIEQEFNLSNIVFFLSVFDIKEEEEK